MSVVSRGLKNAFRNWLRSGAVVVILAIGIGLSLSMLIANQAVQGKINDLRAQVGTTLTIRPAGAQGFQGGGEPLKTSDVNTIKNVAHVAAVSATDNFVLRDASVGDASNVESRGGHGFMFAGPAPGQTNLQSSIDPGTLGRRFAGGDAATQAPNFGLPVRGLGTSGAIGEDGKDLHVTDGRALNSTDTNSALVGKGLAAKNSLKVGSTFSAYNETFTVVGIFDTGIEFTNDVVAIPLATAQRLTAQPDEVSTIIAQVDSVENVDATSSAITSALGSGKADITSSQDNVKDAIDSLQSVQRISMVGFIASLIASAVITLLIMLVIVRERRREIGVLKAIGGSNTTIVTQFVVEALVLVVLGTVVGLGLTLGASSSIAQALVSTSESTATTDHSSGSGPTMMSTGGGGAHTVGSGFRTFRFGGNGADFKTSAELVGQVATSVGPITLVWGALAALGIAIVGSAIPAWLIAKVRPAEVMRGE